MFAVRSSKAGKRKPSSGCETIWLAMQLWNSLSPEKKPSSDFPSLTGQMLQRM